MNSHQVNFFYHPCELGELEEFFRCRGSVFIIEPISSNTNIYSDSITLPVDRLFRKILLTKRDFANDVSIRYVPEQFYYLVQETSSCVVEFTSGGFCEEHIKELSRARLYVEMSFYDSDGKKCEKRVEFKTWAKKLMKDFKQQFLMVSDGPNFIYITKLAAEWKHSTGAQFDEGAFKLSAAK